MNFLAHLFLSAHDPALQVGNFVADFVPNSWVATLPPAIQRGVAMHRFIDHFTDTHPLVRRATRTLHARHHKYAPVLIDVYFDFLLSQNWTRFSEVPLAVFAAKVYEVLHHHRALMPPDLQHRLDLMISDNWLHKYSSFSGMQQVFERMQSYVSRPEWLEGATDSLIEQRVELEKYFLAVFEELQQKLRTQTF